MHRENIVKGINTIELNYEAVQEAITEYLAARFVTPPIVLGIGGAECTSWYVNSLGQNTTDGALTVRIQEPIEFLQGKKP